YSKYVFQLAVVVLCPAVSSRRCIDQLGGNANAISSSPDAALQHVAHAQLASDLAYIDRPALVLEARIAGDDEKLAEPRQFRDDVFDDAVCEVVLLGIGGQICKR